MKSIDGEHTCSRNMTSNRQMKSTWLAEQFLEIFKSRPHWPADEIIETVIRVYRVLIKKGFIYKIKYWAHKKLHGSMKEHYNKINRYVQALKDNSPNSVFKVVVDPPIQSGPPIFKRMYVSLDALSEGWMDGCRKVICLDGCFMKTFLVGMLLAAVGRDANDQMYPICWATVEGENNDSWEWFLTELRDTMKDRNSGKGWTFISDQQKGILNAVSAVFSEAEHRNCARHIFANWHKAYKGDEMKGYFWKAAKAYNEADVNDAMNEMAEANPNAAAAFRAKDPKTFCRAFIDTTTKCDVIINNMAKTFNGYIINARAKHLLHMLEDIRTALMTRLHTKKLEMERRVGLLCPRIQEKLEKEKDKAGKCSVMPSDETVFQISYMLDALTVDIQNRTCTCRKWQLTGIPCCHALAAIYFRNFQAAPYVDECYFRSTYAMSYSRAISPVVGERHWPHVVQPIDPPHIKVEPGRPRRNRRKDLHESTKRPGRLTRHGAELHCSVCRSSEHTKRKCPDRDRVVEPPTKRGRGRPRKHGDTQTRATTEQPVSANSSTHHSATAEPSRTGRNGRTIRGGRGGRGPRGSAGRSGGRQGRGRGQGNIPFGFGAYVAENGATIINNPGQAAPFALSAGVNNISHPTSCQASASAS